MSAASVLARARPASSGPPRALTRTSHWIEWFVLFQIVCQVALLSGDIGAFRPALRIAAFGLSLFLLVAFRRRGRAHPAARPARWVLLIVGLSFFHPTTNGVLSGAAHVALYFAILGPIFWVSRVKIDVGSVRRMFLILWAFHTFSAGVGILQVSFPGSFQPSLSSVIAGIGEDYVNDLEITLASGVRVFRPMGLTDVPGGAAIAGFYAVLLGLGFLLADRRAWMRIAATGSMSVGMTCLYLSQVRSVLLMAIISMLGVGAVLAWRGRARVPMFTVVVATVLSVSFAWAVSIGGDSVTGRIDTLVAASPGAVYYANRGQFLEHTIDELLPRFPFGAGLGRWGMINAYFGEAAGPERGPLWVEIQWTGWLLDGGVPLIAAYVAAVVMAFAAVLRIASFRKRRELGELWLWATVVLGYDLGATAVTFNCPLFIGQGGLEFWLINAVLFGAAQGARPAARTHEAPTA